LPSGRDFFKTKEDEIAVGVIVVPEPKDDAAHIRGPQTPGERR
jgi:hypothetical protein